MSVQSLGLTWAANLRAASHMPNNRPSPNSFEWIISGCSNNIFITYFILEDPSQARYHSPLKSVTRRRASMQTLTQFWQCVRTLCEQREIKQTADRDPTDHARPRSPPVDRVLASTLRRRASASLAVGALSARGRGGNHPRCPPAARHPRPGGLRHAPPKEPWPGAGSRRSTGELRA
jgi:hypothetical protein